MNAMSYQGYTTRIEYDPDDRLFVGHLAGIRDIVGFHGTSVAELEAVFHESVDDYLSMCKQLGQSPDKPASGKMMMLRVPPEVHRAALIAAETSGVSLNQWAAQALAEAAHHV